MRVSHLMVAVLVSVTLVALGALIMKSLNGGFYEFWINYDPQTDDQQYYWYKVNAFMTATSGLCFGLLVALLLGAGLAQRLPGLLRPLLTAVVAAALLAVANFAVAWPLSARSRQSLMAVSRRFHSESLPFIPDLLDNRGFQHVLGAGFAAYLIAAAAGVGLGMLITAQRRAPYVAAAIVAAVVTAIVGLFNTSVHTEVPKVVVLFALVPPSAAIPAVVHTALDNHGDAAIAAMLGGGATWAVLLVTTGWRVRRRRDRRAR